MWKFVPVFLLFAFIADSEARAKIMPKALPKIASPSVAPSVQTLKIYEIGKTDGPMLYLQKIQREFLPDGKVRTQTWIQDPYGKKVFSETILSKGSEPIQQSNDVEQTKRHLELEVKDGQVFLKTRALYPENKEVPKEDRETLPENFITGALAENFILEHWDEIMADETVYARLAVMELREIIKFKFWKKQTTKIRGKEVIEVIMKPTSFLIAFLLEPIHFFIDPKEKKMIQYIGRTPLWKVNGSDLSPLDAEIVVD